MEALERVDFLERSPEEFAGSHNLILPDEAPTGAGGPDDDGAPRPPPSAPSQFSVDLGKRTKHREDAT